MYSRNCPKCNSILFHKSKYTRNSANKKGTICGSCSKRKCELKYYENLSRNCPNCDNIIKYSHIGDKIKAYKNNTLCKKCMLNSGKYIKGQEPTNTKSIYICWLNKFGKGEADLKLEKFKQLQSFNNSGNKNSMYGKCTPIGSGNGWSGWYKGWYFRSILELSYVIKVIERYNLNWQSAEKNTLTCKYIFNNAERTYRADFIINSKYLVDCKPKKLQKSLENLAKREAMSKFCNSIGLIFKYSDIPKLTNDEILELYIKKQIKFLDRYEKKFKEKYRDLL